MTDSASPPKNVHIIVEQGLNSHSKKPSLRLFKSKPKSPDAKKLDTLAPVVRDLKKDRT